jgi:hypothetical protein
MGVFQCLAKVGARTRALLECVFWPWPSTPFLSWDSSRRSAGVALMQIVNLTIFALLCLLFVCGISKSFALASMQKR